MTLLRNPLSLQHQLQDSRKQIRAPHTIGSAMAQPIRSPRTHTRNSADSYSQRLPTFSRLFARQKIGYCFLEHRFTSRLRRPTTAVTSLWIGKANFKINSTRYFRDNELDIEDDSRGSLLVFLLFSCVWHA
jgi:hypothetical protein